MLHVSMLRPLLPSVHCPRPPRPMPHRGNFAQLPNQLHDGFLVQNPLPGLLHHELLHPVGVKIAGAACPCAFPEQGATDVVGELAALGSLGGAEPGVQAYPPESVAKYGMGVATNSLELPSAQGSVTIKAPVPGLPMFYINVCKRSATTATIHNDGCPTPAM